MDPNQFGNLFNDGDLTLRVRLVRKVFPSLKDKRDLLLQISPFIVNSPKMGFETKSFELLYNYLSKYFNKDKNGLLDLFCTNEKLLNIAFETLDKEATNEYHFKEMPKEEGDRLNFIDHGAKILYPVLIEGVFDIFLYFLHECVKNELNIPTSPIQPIFNICESFNKNIKANEGLNQVENIIELFNDTVRNGIAHHQVEFSMSNISFTDKRGNTIKKSHYEFIKMTDDLFNSCNGFYLAIIIFLAENIESLKIAGFILPKILKYNEITETSRLKSWQIENLLESVDINNQKQLNIFVKNNMYLNDTVEYLAADTAIKAERIASGYDKYVVRMPSKYSLFGTAGFIGKKLKSFRESGIKDRCIDDNGFLYFSEFNPPNFIIQVYRILYFLFVGIKNIKLSKFQMNKYEIISSDLPHHKRWNWSCISNSVVSLNTYNFPDSLDIKSYIKQNTSLIMRDTIKESKKRLPWYSILRFKPVGYLEIKIIKRRVNIRTNTLDLNICSIVFCKIKNNFSNSKIRIGCNREGFSNYDIYWKA